MSLLKTRHEKVVFYLPRRKKKEYQKLVGKGLLEKGIFGYQF